MSLYSEDKGAAASATAMTTMTASPSSVISISPAVLMNMNHGLFALTSQHTSLSSLWPIRENFFVPDFTEHPKPHPKKRPPSSSPTPLDEKLGKPDEQQDENTDITFFHDFVAGGAAGSASVVVGHPFDTIKVRVQTSVGSTGLLSEFGGISSLFRGMAAPLVSATFINAIVFGSYGLSSRLYDEYISSPNNIDFANNSSSSSNDNSSSSSSISNIDDNDAIPSHDPWQKSGPCGSFAGLVQCVIICPMEHIKCRLQVQCSKSGQQQFKGPVQITQYIVQNYGIRRLYQGWWVTCSREIPAFGLYFASYDYMKDAVNNYLSRRQALQERQLSQRPGAAHHSHTWIASAVAGGCAGSLTWAIVYPVDVIKTTIQTAPLVESVNHPERIKMLHVGIELVRRHGWRYMFRGLGITLIRAFPVNATLFPVYEFTLMQVCALEKRWAN